MPIIYSEEYDRVRANLGRFPVFVEILSPDWIDSNILNSEDRLEKHMLFWDLLDDTKVTLLATNLNIIKRDTNILPSIASKLKRLKTMDEFDPFRTEILVLGYYKSKETTTLRVEYEPLVPGSTRRNDILITDNGTPHYIEIFTLTNDGIDRNNIVIQSAVSRCINELTDNPFIISFMIYSSFKEMHIEGFMQFIRNKIESFRQMDEIKFDVTYAQDEILLAEVWFVHDDNVERGFVGAMHTDVRELNDDARIKNRILTKTEQVSPTTRNILVTNLLYAPTRVDEYYNGLLGRETLSINPTTHATQTFRLRDGAWFDERARKFGCFICFERNDYANRRKIPNPNSTHAISQQVIDLL